MTKVLVDKDQLIELVKSYTELSAMQSYGVDNWEGYDLVDLPSDEDNLSYLNSISEDVIDLVIDNETFQTKYEFNKEPLTLDKLKFRNDLLSEEFSEIQEALETKNAEEWVDGHIDLLVIAIGNLYLAGIDIKKAWREVFRANMSKVRGVKPGREQSGGFDVIKPEGWVGPSHNDNHGLLREIFNGEK